MIQPSDFQKRIHDVMTRPRVVRVTVLLKVTCVLCVLVFMVWQVHLQVYSRRIREVPLSLAMSFLLVQAALIFGTLLLSSIIKKKDETRRHFSDRALPVIREHLAEHVAGQDRSRPLFTLCLWHGADVQQCLMDYISMVDGDARARLSQLAADLGLRWLWEKVAQYGTADQRKEAAFRLWALDQRESRPVLWGLLKDRSSQVQAAACRALIRLGDQDDVGLVFLHLLDAPFMVRAILVSDLTVHAPMLLEGPFRAVVDEGNEDRIGAALGMAQAWMTPLPWAALVSLLVHRSPKIRAAAMKMMANHSNDSEIELWVYAGIADPDVEVRAEAIRVAGILRLHTTLAALEMVLDSECPSDIHAGCRAIAAMGKPGWKILERSILTRDAQVAAQAAEALGCAQLARSTELEYA